MHNLNPLQIREWIAAAIPCEKLEVAGDGAHFQALVVSDNFAGLSRIARHQLIYRALGEKMAGEIHALSMKTLTPDEWRNQNG